MAGVQSRASRWWVAAILTASAVLAYAPDFPGFVERLSDREQYFPGDVLMTNPDAYFYLRSAREVYHGEWTPGEQDPLRFHPDGRTRGEAPWLSRLIAFIARFVDGDVYVAGLWFAFLSSSLFAIPLLLYARLIGWPAAGLFGALTGAASMAMWLRTGLPRMEPDGFNIFAFSTICLIFALLRPEMSRTRHVAIGAAAGLAVALAAAWYRKPGLILLFAPGLLVSARACGLTWRRIALVGAAFGVACNPFSLEPSIRHFFNTARSYRIPGFGSPPAEAVAGEVTGWSPLEHSSLQIQERMPLGIEEALTRMIDPPWLAALGLLCFVGWAVLQWRRAAALLPLVILGALGLYSRRFLMFLAPLAGFGLGALVTIVTRRAMRSTRFSGYTNAVACLLALVICLAILPQVVERRPKRSWLPIQIVSGFKECAQDLPPGSVVWHSWSYGYLIQDVMGAATHIDGGKPNPVIDHLLAKAVSGPDGGTLQKIFGYLDQHPQRAVVDEFREDYSAALQRLLGEEAVPESPTFVAFTAESVSGLRTSTVRGQWELETERPEPPKIWSLRCKKARRHILHCRGGMTVDSARGVIRFGEGRPQVTLSRMLTVADGFAQQVREYDDESGMVLEVLEPNAAGISDVYAMEPVAHDSIVNQAYVLGRVDERYLELACDRFPHLRLYRVRGAPSDLATTEGPE